MKQLLSLVFLLNCLSVFAQEPAYTPMRLNYQFRGIKTDSLFLVPSYTDTNQANNYTVKNIGGALIRTGSDFWMRNGTATAWLQNVNVGPGASPTVQFVDSIWRVAGKDSIFWRKGSVTNKIKDSIGPVYAGDSPDRINGIATGSVTADLDGNIMRFSDADQFKVDITGEIYLEADSILKFTSRSMVHETKNSKYEFKDFNNTFLSIDTIGNFFLGERNNNPLIIGSKTDSSFSIVSKSPSIWDEPNSGIKSQIKTGFGDNDIDLSVADYEIKVPGIYIIAQGSLSQKIILPDALLWKGQSIQLVSTDGVTDSNLDSIGGNIYDRGTSTTFSLIGSKSMMIFYSDGKDWYGFKN